MWGDFHLRDYRDDGVTVTGLIIDKGYGTNSKPVAKLDSHATDL